MRDAGVTALKIEGRQRGRAYVAAVVSAYRRLIDGLEQDDKMPADRLTEGQRDTIGAYGRRWR